MRSHLRRIGNDLLHFIAPSLCPACDAPLAVAERRYCGACRASLEPAPFPRDIFVELAGRFPGDELAISAIASLYTFEADGPVQRLIHALKYRGCYEIGVELGGELAGALRMFREFETFDIIVPVPLHRARRRERGYNQAEAIGRGISRRMGDLPVGMVLARARHTVSQTTLGAGARHANMAGAFSFAGGDVRDLTVLLCDDVCTTGATLNACAERLLGAGARKVLAATAAKDVG
jgi:ComF family protein